MKHRKRSANLPRKVDHEDKGANGMAYLARPFGDVKVERFVYRGYQDSHLIDRMMMRAQLTERQHQAALKVLEMHEASGFEPKVVGGYAPSGWGKGHDDELDEAEAIGRFRSLLGDCSSPAAMILHGMCLEQHPGTARLASLHAALDDLADRWKIVRGVLTNGRWQVV